MYSSAHAHVINRTVIGDTLFKNHSNGRFFWRAAKALVRVTLYDSFRFRVPGVEKFIGPDDTWPALAPRTYFICPRRISKSKTGAAGWPSARAPSRLQSPPLGQSGRSAGQQRGSLREPGCSDGGGGGGNAQSPGPQACRRRERRAASLAVASAVGFVTAAAAHSICAGDRRCPLPPTSCSCASSSSSRRPLRRIWPRRSSTTSINARRRRGAPGLRRRRRRRRRRRHGRDWQRAAGRRASAGRSWRSSTTAGRST